MHPMRVAYKSKAAKPKMACTSKGLKFQQFEAFKTVCKVAMTLVAFSII